MEMVRALFVLLSTSATNAFFPCFLSYGTVSFADSKLLEQFKTLSYLVNEYNSPVLGDKGRHDLIDNYLVFSSTKVSQ